MLIQLNGIKKNNIHEKCVDSYVNPYGLCDGVSSNNILNKSVKYMPKLNEEKQTKNASKTSLINNGLLWFFS
jgi:hypothetical protein